MRCGVVDNTTTITTVAYLAITVSIPLCTNGTTNGGTLHDATSRPTPLRHGCSRPLRLRVPSGKMCTHDPLRSRSSAATMPGCSRPAPRSTGSTCPARKNLVIHAFWKHLSVAHSVQRMLDGDKNALGGSSAEVTSGSSSAATWLQTVMRGWPAGRCMALARWCPSSTVVLDKACIKTWLTVPTLPTTSAYVVCVCVAFGDDMGGDTTYPQDGVGVHELLQALLLHNRGGRDALVGSMVLGFCPLGFGHAVRR